MGPPHPTSGQAGAGEAISPPVPVTTHDHVPPACAVDNSPPSPEAQEEDEMIFSDLYKSPKSPLSRLRSHHAQALAEANPDYDADLLSRDKAKQKEAVKKVLAAKVRNDWEFKWPDRTQEPPIPQVKNASQGQSFVPHSEDSALEDQPHEHENRIDGDLDSDNDDAASVYSTVSEDATHWRTRLEWASDLSDDEDQVSPSAYRFDSPDTVGVRVKEMIEEKRAKRRRTIREEAKWNQGLACFNARRDTWTGAKTVRVRPKPPPSPVSSSPSRRISFFGLSTSPSSTSNSASTATSSPLSQTATRSSGDSRDTTVYTSSDAERSSHESSRNCCRTLYPVETLLPIPAPILPPANPMRASITPSTYFSIYDRVVVHSMTPACPVNLSDVMKSCVAGWKRDGEWPCRPITEAATIVAVRSKKKPRDTNAAAEPKKSPSNGTRRMSFVGLLGRRESNAADQAAAAATAHLSGSLPSDERKGIRKSLQKALGLGHERVVSNASNCAPAIAG